MVNNRERSFSPIRIAKVYLFFDITPTESLTQRNRTELIQTFESWWKSNKLFLLRIYFFQESTIVSTRQFVDEKIFQHISLSLFAKSFRGTLPVVKPNCSFFSFSLQNIIRVWHEKVSGEHRPHAGAGNFGQPPNFT